MEKKSFEKEGREEMVILGSEEWGEENLGSPSTLPASDYSARSPVSIKHRHLLSTKVLAG